MSNKGLCKEKEIPKIRDYYGSGWVGSGLTQFFFNHPKIPLNQYDILEKYTTCIMSVYALINVVSYYDLSVLSMSVMGFQKQKFGWVELYPRFFLDFGIF